MQRGQSIARLSIPAAAQASNARWGRNCERALFKFGEAPLPFTSIQPLQDTSEGIWLGKFPKQEKAKANTV